MSAHLESRGEKPRGRPRSFDRDAALRAAMKTFWKLGFEGASMSELTRAMGINAPSLYACFGSKEDLFIDAVRLYLETDGSQSRKAMAVEAKAHDGLAAMLRQSAASLARPGFPHGCLLILGDANASAENDRIRHFLMQRRHDIQAGMEARLRRGIADGDIPAEADIAAVAAFYMTVLQGLSLRARDGASREAMLQIVELAMAAWDGLVATAAHKRSKPKPVAEARRKRA